MVRFAGEYAEPLDPSTLWVGPHNVLYCRVRKGRFEARFSRRCYLEFARHVEFDAESMTFYIEVDKKRYVIKGVP